ncbi:MAG: GMC family oxidoreductase, partial [Pseudomonadota bacterium]|nr:GMC family oxidoreductase [Pseudomonadota bacterium]
RHHLVGLRFTSAMENARQGDMFVVANTKSFWHAVGRQFGSMVISANKCYSETGQVRLRSADWKDYPVVEFNLLSDRRDLVRLMDALKLMARVHLQPEMTAVTTDPFPAIWGDRVQQFGEVNLRNKLFTDLAARLLDGPKFLHDLLMRNFVFDRYSVQDILHDEEKLEDFVRKGTIGLWHASSSCRMGDKSDPMAVVDSHGRVHGLAGLRICDTSIFPVIPAATPFFPAMMAAEKISDSIAAGH